MKFLIVTGMSGAGKSKAVDCLEDMGFYCIDNMPLDLINQFIELSEMGTSEIDRAAFVIDMRGRGFFDDFVDRIHSLKDEGRDFRILFLEASDEVLIRRYQESRRMHPMNDVGSLPEGIKEERKRLSEIRKISDYIIDTSQINTTQLRKEISDLVDSSNTREEKRISISIMSFGYKHGIPLEADNVFDVRFIPNPFYVNSLKKLTGNNKKVRDYVLKWEETESFIEQYHKLITGLIQYYVKQGKSHLVLAFGCTGGQHRSVTIANEFYDIFSSQGYRVTVSHRDL